MLIKVQTQLCTGCESCVSSCPYDAIHMKDAKAFVNEYCQVCRICLNVCPEGAIQEIDDDKDTKDAQDLSKYKGVLIFAEQRQGAIAHVAFELLGVGRKLADSLGVPLNAALFGANDNQATELIRWGADKVYLCSDESLQVFNDEPYADLMTDVINDMKPEIVLAGATAIGRSFIPRVAARIRAGLTADCTSLDIDTQTRNLLAIRPAFGGNIMATIVCPAVRPQMATVRPRVMKSGLYDANKTGEIVSIEASTNARTKVIAFMKEEGGCACTNLHEADIIVSGGRGVGGPEGFEKLRELAELLGAAIGASRAVVDEGWIEYSHQVGQTGKTVCPKVYIACGISGAVQHLVGMQSTDIIIAINKNPQAPIFNVANYGIVADVKELIPLLIKKLKENKRL
ncbi:MAG: FAD-binding protein [Candidatus Magnetoovum sp. WYHC-5]|nr:FAD-binding protein [Candidatus Magnetoovum sp. WYHC-5]